MDKTKERYVTISRKHIFYLTRITFMMSFVFVSGVSLIGFYFNNVAFEPLVYIYYLSAIWVTTLGIGIGMNLLMKMMKEDD